MLVLSHPPSCKYYSQSVCDGLVKMRKALNLWMKDMNRKHVLTNGYVLHQKALSLYKDFSKGSPEMRDTKPFIAS